MVLAIVRKELRETLAFAALALGLHGVYLSSLMGTWNGQRTYNAVLGWVPFAVPVLGSKAGPIDVPFVQDRFVAVSCAVGAALAVALGFRQSAWEPSQGTALYLLHLPLYRHRLFLTKLLTGTGLLLACTALPIVVYATWAAQPRTHAGPFSWSMTGPALRVWLLMPVFYLGAFASGIRPARWFGSRLLPLAAAAVPAVLAYVIPQWWLIGIPVLLAVTAVLVSNILWEAATRDY
jgi:hypothetical protein